MAEKAPWYGPVMKSPGYFGESQAHQSIPYPQRPVQPVDKSQSIALKCVVG
jgi:hypothetical protein